MPPSDERGPRTESLYFRASPKLREDVEQLGEERGLTLSSALAVLVERGLEAVANDSSVVRLERRVSSLTQDLAVYQERDRNWRAWFDSLQGQMRAVRVGTCPRCQQVVTAFDQFFARACPWPNCGEALQQVLPPPKADEFPPAVAGLFGALGGFLFGVAASQSK